MNTVAQSIFLAMLLLVSAPVAAQSAEQLTPTSWSGGRQGLGVGQMQRMELMQNEDMVTALTRMAKICKRMMEKEMAIMPYKLAAGVGLGVLVVIVLLLLIVLEVQWIIYWRRLLRQQKRGS